jgi:4-hydroxy-2-oxoheptanedioate aldolase
MQGLNRVRTVLDKGEVALGVWQLLPGSNMSRTLARAGYDWVLVDCEHGNIDGKSIEPARMSRNAHFLLRCRNA